MMAKTLSSNTIDNDIYLRMTLGINGMENFVYMNWVNLKNQNFFSFVIALRATLNKTLTAKNNDILPSTL